METPIVETQVLDPISTVHLQGWEETYHLVKGYAVAKEMNNTLIALSVAMRIHEGQTRDNGEPYIIHPLKVCELAMNLGIDDDITCASAILHDCIEDGKLKDPEKLFTRDFGLDKKVYEIVSALSKPKNYKKTDPEQEMYLSKIKSIPEALIIKLLDRANNMSTLDSFIPERMKKYVKETKEKIYPLCKYGKSYYPQYSNAITIIKYRIVAICETIEALIGKNDDSIPKSFVNYKKTFMFIKGYAKGKGLKNTTKALYLAERLHEGQLRKSGDPFIIHPLRVCSYLISLKINTDHICAAALLHEILKKCNLEKKGEELVSDYGFDKEVLDLVKAVSNFSKLPTDEYYESLKLNKEALLIKLSNKANTCTILQSFSDEEKKEYILETEKYVESLCRFGEAYYPEFSEQIVIMETHINALCKIVKVFLPKTQ